MTPSAAAAVLIVRDSVNDPVDDDAACRKAVNRARWFQSIGQKEEWPVTTEIAVALLSRGGSFAVDETELLRLVACEILPPLAVDEDGDAEWSATDILEASRILEGRRQWQAESPHSLKMTNLEHVLYAARRDDDVLGVAQGLQGHDVLGALSAMVLSESREVRIACSVIIRLLLEAGAGVKV